VVIDVASGANVDNIDSINILVKISILLRNVKECDIEAADLKAA
jgi:hypothetical protein